MAAGGTAVVLPPELCDGSDSSDAETSADPAAAVAAKSGTGGELAAADAKVDVRLAAKQAQQAGQDGTSAPAPLAALEAKVEAAARREGSLSFFERQVGAAPPQGTAGADAFTIGVAPQGGSSHEQQAELALGQGAGLEAGDEIDALAINLLAPGTLLSSGAGAAAADGTAPGAHPSASGGAARLHSSQGGLRRRTTGSQHEEP